MSRWRCLSRLAVRVASALFAQTGPDPREQSFQFFVDGV